MRVHVYVRVCVRGTLNSRYDFLQYVAYREVLCALQGRVRHVRKRLTNVILSVCAHTYTHTHGISSLPAGRGSSDPQVRQCAPAPPPHDQLCWYSDNERQAASLHTHTHTQTQTQNSLYAPCERLSVQCGSLDTGQCVKHTARVATRGPRS